VRLDEREMAAYCIVRGIDYIVEECPMADGNRHLGYKEALNVVEERSPGAKHAFYFEFLARASSQFRPPGGHEVPLQPCARCGSPTTGEICAFCSLIERATAPAAGSEGRGGVASPADGQAPEGAAAPVAIGATRRRR
jgi:tRNA-5-methyluridine54 2-sulfurtransferase